MCDYLHIRTYSFFLSPTSPSDLSLLREEDEQCSTMFSLSFSRLSCLSGLRAWEFVSLCHSFPDSLSLPDDQ